MDQNQLDDLESKEEGYSERDSLEERNETGAQGATDVTSNPDEQSEFGVTSEEKVNDVNDIIDNGDDNKTEEKVEENKTETATNLSEGSSNECGTSSGCSTTSNLEEKKEDPWNVDDNNEKKPGSTWRIISGVLLVLLVIAVYTNGFNFTGAVTAGTPITQIDAEDAVLDFVNSNLLQPPFTATVESSKELDNLFQVTLDVSGQEVDSYVTKDGRFFFPQGFDLEAPLDLDSGPTGSEAPETELVEVSIDDDAVLGNEDAPVTIVEFSDFQCPYCKRGWDVMKQVEKDYVESGKVKIVFRDFPLGFHDQAKPSAMAAECAHEQGKFWEYHDLLFENQGSLSMANYKKWAADLSLDTEKFNDCLDSEKYAEEVDKDFADGQSYGVSGTPAFFVNGKMISGAQPFDVFKQAIEEALQGSPSESQETDEVTEEETEEVVEEIETQPAETKEIQITAKKWRFDPKVVEVNQGDTVVLTVDSDEIDLNFILSAFTVSKKVTADEPVTVEFVADKKGTFEFMCGDYCNKYGVVQGTALKGELVVN